MHRSHNTNNSNNPNSTRYPQCECPFELKAVKGKDGWTVSIHNGTDNHTLGVCLEGHSYAGRLLSEQTSTVVDLSVSLVKPREILTHLKVQDLENVTPIKAVYNLFWSPPSAGEILRAFSRVLMMDCTYKTNKYKFFLVQIVGVTSPKMTFCAAFAFMKCEKTENYTWVLEKLKGMMDPNMLPSVTVMDRELALMNAITNVFPHATNFLCRWHIG
ncbi:protein FAR1-RELATED SEQUENCE 5-like [Rhododendron vialii]|uniref:protein FAR1-RELATED SEQUENCE 5-like n=1 Tax=Rhododendron vialii TaxID=182163 RepID=UPI00265F3897|nr:protein FAR1-RELATED SEQUENCE 5-like [Rhododendron vialii]